MTNIASKNLFDLLGNDPDLDPDREPEPPTKAIDKPTQRAGKRNAGAEGPASGASRARGGARGGRQDAFTGSEQAFRDRDAGRFSNRSKPADDSSGFSRGRGRGGGGGGGRGGGRGGRGGGPRDDRHSKTGIADHEKQAAHGWGGQTGGDEWADERAGEAIAKEEEKAGFDTNVGPPVNADGEEFKPDLSGEGATNAWAPDGEDAKEPEEDKTMSYAAYLAEQTEKKLSLGLGELEARKPNEGRDKKFPTGKALARDDNEENYMAGSSGKAARTREKKEKTRLQLDDERLLKAPELGGGRGGRGRGRGDSFRGEGGRGRGDSFRGDGGRGRGDSFRGDSGRGTGRGGRGDRGSARGFGGGERGRGRGGRGGGNVNVNDQSAFPSLGS